MPEGDLGWRPRLWGVDEYGQVARQLALAHRVRQIAVGHLLIVIEHKLDVIAAADWIIDLGPEGGGCGGRLLAAETPEEALAACADSHTGQALAPFLASRRPPE